MEPLNNTLTANEARNDLGTISTNAVFIENPTTHRKLSVVHRTSRSISRGKLTVFVSVTVAIVIIILVIIVPILGLRKSD
ncbi:unnamed protein product [Rotaria sordida]|uniref:Uncharacterized protein n=1 Tax=Rotaria sordida TaxID=392033 RepID=A0A813ZSB2_9BILA|nr:unnamed protein product [Rotaria sordida]CAF0971769.1 unnamed protein product [Rotaria sordida]CAF1030127.1 unnamed protein product [Rotaria sordida]CAF1051193.1 unnamed protein product [Rotaria sordida]